MKKSKAKAVNGESWDKLESELYHDLGYQLNARIIEGMKDMTHTDRGALRDRLNQRRAILDALIAMVDANI